MRVPAAGVMTTSPMPPATLQALEEQRRGAAEQLLGAAPAVLYTLNAAGSFKPTSSLCSIDTLGAAATDDLASITPELDETAPGYPGFGLIVLRATSTARTVVVKHMAPGTYPIETATGTDFALDDDAKRIILELRSNLRWYEVDRFYAADSAAARAAIGVTSIAALAPPANPGDDGKMVTASGGSWVHAAPPVGGDGIKTRSINYAGSNQNYANGGVIRFDESAFGSPNTDTYAFTAPAVSAYLGLEVSALVERQNDNNTYDFVTLRVGKRFTPSAGFDTSGAKGARGLPSRTFFYRPSTDDNRLKEARVSLASGVFPMTSQQAVRVQVDGVPANSYKVNGGSPTKCWISLAWM